MSEAEWPYLFPPPPDTLVQHVGGGDFLSIGQSLCQQVVQVGLKPEQVILDVGCGVGRLAVPMTDYLSPQGRFYGFDVHRPSIEWCVEHISSRFPHFHFDLLDVFHPHYNPGGVLLPTKFQFPYEDQSLDFVSLWSVFTHLQLPEIDHFCSEIRRTLRSGGSILISCFLLTQNREECEKKSDFYRGLMPISPLVKAMDPAIPERALAYEEQRFLGGLEKHGFSIGEIQYGTWCGTELHTFLGYQDRIVLSRE
jgi:ubiquinone/menaquinone biosynthesis C-methylase UbiE